LKNNLVQCYYYNNARVRLKATQAQKILSKKFLVENVSVEFEDGTIKNIYADMRVNDSLAASDYNLPIRFKNTYPISISSRTDPDMFGDIKIFVGRISDVNKHYELKDDTSKPDMKTIRKAAASIKDTSGGIIFFYLSDLLDYAVIADNDREDYSPVNCTVQLNKNSPTIELRKEKRSKILSVQAFTDFMGIQNEQPNGVIQIEAFKRININTNKYGNRLVYYSLSSYAEPILAFTKIEKNKNALPLNFKDIDSVALKTGKKSLITSPIDLYKYQKTSFDVKWNLIKVNFSEIKSSLHLNLQVGIMKSNITDSITVTGNNQAIKSTDENISVVNTFRYGLGLMWDIKPENRYGVTFGWDFRYLDLLNETYILIKPPRPALSTIWANAFLKTNEENKLFFRYRITFDHKDVKKNFTEIQLGYQMNLFKSSK
jgi:hypothetical protein